MRGSRWSAGIRLIEFCTKAQERNEIGKPNSDHFKGRKTLKGEAHERWGLKKASKVETVKNHHRNKGSQTLHAGLLGNRATFPGRSLKEGTKKRTVSSGNAEGPKILCEVRFEDGLKSTEAIGKDAAGMRGSRLRWHGSAREDCRENGKIFPAALKPKTLRSTQ